MPDIQHIVVGTRNPTPGDASDFGSAEEGFYTVDGDVLTMVNVDGAPLRNSSGERVTARITDGTTPRQVAARLVLSRWRTERDGDDPNGFNRPLRYSNPGWM